MGIPQIIMIVLIAIGTALHIIKHGEEYKRGGVALLVNLPLMVGVLYYGGFFTTLAAPQIIMIVLLTINATTSLLFSGKYVKYNGFACLIDVPLQVGLLQWGGFWG